MNKRARTGLRHGSALVALGIAASLAATTAAYATTTTTGVLEVCKTASSTSVTGTFSFTITGVSGTVSAPVGGCSLPVKVAAGNVTVTEVAKAGSTLEAVSTLPADRLVSTDLAAAKATVKVVAGTVANQTIVTFKNKPTPPKKGTVKVCKIAGPGVAANQEFSFDVAGVKTTAKAGHCSAPLSVPVGRATVTESLTAGYQVTAITVAGAGSLVSTNLGTGTAVINVVAGVTEVTYTNKKNNRPPNCSKVTATPGEIWPPNHKFVTVSLSGATDPDGDKTTLKITGVTQDEAINGSGDGDTAPDAAWVSGRTDQVQVRAERSGNGDGRVYRIAFTVSDGKASCHGTVSVGVPHDQSGGAAVDTRSVVVNSFGS